jgi:hypothetical protein
MLATLVLYDRKPMALKVDLRQFLDDEGNASELTEQAKKVFNFLTKIVSSVSKNIEHPGIYVDVKCDTRAEELHCDGGIEARCIAIGMIKWHCDTCEASGTISNWQGSLWDKQKRIIH